MPIGNGCTYTASCKQKLNTKSSTEAELWCYGADTMGEAKEWIKEEKESNDEKINNNTEEWEKRKKARKMEIKMSL